MVRKATWFWHNSKQFSPYDEDDDDMIQKYFLTHRVSLKRGDAAPPLTLRDGKHYVVLKHEADEKDIGNYVTKLYQYSNSLLAGRPRVVDHFPVPAFPDFATPHSPSTPVDHLVFVVHGIGEAMWSRKDVPVDDVVGCARQLRRAHKELNHNHAEVRSAKEAGGGRMTGRVEFLPIAWHSVVHDKERDDMLSRVTQKTVPGVRALANQVIVDILFYCDPEHRLLMANKIATQANSLYALFVTNNPSFSGKVSFVAHSLGSVILFDLLRYAIPPPSIPSSPVASFDEEALPPRSPQKLRRKLSDVGCFAPVSFDFAVTNLFAIGSPIGFFATVRGNELGPKYKFPTCSHIYNVFHPHDPVGYRLEPAIDPELANVEPLLVPTHTGWDAAHIMIKKGAAAVTNMFTSFFGGGSVSTEPAKAHDSLLCEHISLNGGERIDHVVQENPLSAAGPGAYLSAILSHNGYWYNMDVSLFVALRLLKTSS